MDVSIVIINYRTPNLVDNCLASIFSLSEGFSYEAVIIDNSNARKDFLKVASVVAKYQFAKLIDGHGNLGTSKANKLGASVSTGDFFFFLNSDTILKNNAIFFMLKCFQTNPNIGAVCGNLFDKNGAPTHSYILKESSLSQMKRAQSLLCRRFTKDKNYQFNFTSSPIAIGGYICSADLLVSRKCFYDVGGFDEDIFMYSEDALFGHSLLLKGYVQLCTPGAMITHLEGASDSTIFSDFKVGNYVDGGFLFHKKAYGEKDAVSFLKLMMNGYKKRYLRNLLLKRKNVAANCLHFYRAYKKKYLFEKHRTKQN